MTAKNQVQGLVKRQSYCSSQVNAQTEINVEVKKKVSAEVASSSSLIVNKPIST